MTFTSRTVSYTHLRGAGNENVMTMLMIYILAGAFSAVAAAMGGRDSVVNLGISLIPVQFLTVGMFIISAFMGTATGTSMGTVASIVPIAAGVAVKSGISEPVSYTHLSVCIPAARLRPQIITRQEPKSSFRSRKRWTVQALIFRFLSWSFIRAINNKYKELEKAHIETLTNTKNAI